LSTTLALVFAALRANAQVSFPDLIAQANHAEKARAYAESEQKYLAALSMLNGRDARDGVVIWNGLGQVNQDQRRFAEAKRDFEAALAMNARLAHPDPDEMIASLNNLGVIATSEGDFRAAEHFLSKAIEIADENGTVALAQTIPVVRENLGVTRVRLAMFREAEDVLSSAASGFRSLGPAFEPSLVLALDCLATTQIERNKLDEADANAAEALAIAVRVDGPESLAVGRIYNTLGFIATRRNKWADARREYESALQIWTKTKSVGTAPYAATLANLGTVENHSGNHKAAEQHYRAALQIDEAVLGDSHPRVAVDLSNIAAQLYSRKKWDEALQLFERARSIQERCLGPSNLQVARTWRNIGAVANAEKRFDDAAEAYAKATALFKTLPESSTPEFGLYLREYAALLRTMQRFSEAENVDLLAMRIEVTNAAAAEKRTASPASGLSFR
jgi:tetratricopeptide (TPR) repeat protein